MTPKRWRQIEQLYHTALNCGTAERFRLLDQACVGDDALRQEVESLLAFDSEAEHFLEALPEDVWAGLLVQDRSQPMAGRVLGRYQILSPLGAGAMGEVYLAQDTHLERKVALKLLRPMFTWDPEQVQRFKQEAHSASALNHPNIITIFEIGEVDDFHFIATEFVDGETLQQRMSVAPLTLQEALDVAIQVAGALSAAHGAGIVHRDVKPANIMRRRDGYIKVVDFGLAKLIERSGADLKTGADRDQVQTHPGWVIGTPRYMSPEQVLAERLDGRTDIFSLGAVLYEMVSGRAPFHGSTTAELIRAVLIEEAPPLQVLSDNAPPELERIARKALAKNCEERYQTAGDLLTDLKDLKLDLELGRRTRAGRHRLVSGYDAPSVSAGASQQSVLRFGVFELDSSTSQLRKNGRRVRLPPQPFKLLTLIASRRGEVVTREEIQRQIWGRRRFVDFGNRMNRCIRQIRTALSDDTETPRFVETLPRRGYRFIAPVEQVGTGNSTLAENVETPGNTVVLVNEPVAEARPRSARVSTRRYTRRRMFITAGIAAAAVVAAAIAGAVWLGRGERSIAVLPFTDRSPDQSEEYLSEGLAEEMRNALARIDGLRVTGSTSSVQFSGNATDARVVGKKLNVDTILEGSVRRQGSRARISVKLIKSRDGFQLWSETYELEMNDIFAVEDEIARAVTAALKVRLLGGKPAGTPVRSTNIEAYNSYLQARLFYRWDNKLGMQKAADYFERATKLDPAYAPAWAGLGQARAAQADSDYIPAKEGYRLGRDAVERALALDPKLAEAHVTLGWIRQDADWDWTGADASYKRALALAPRNASVLGRAGDGAWILGRLDEAIARFRRAIDIDPLDNNLYFKLGLILDSAGRQEEARVALAKALELEPERDGAHFALCRLYLTQSHPEQALAEAEKEKHHVFHLLGLALAYYALGRKESDTNLAELIAKFSADNPYEIADAYAFRGEADKAFEWLERAYGAHDSGLIEMKGDPLLNKVKGDPRYAALLRKMGLPQ